MMDSLKSTQSNRRLRVTRLGITVGLAMLFLAVLLWGLRGVTPVHADPGILHVDGATGQDISTCGTTSTPCKTISYTLNNRASGGDTIRVAQGVYIENLGINISVTLEGGYEPTNWTRNITLYETIIDGGGATFMRPVIDFFAGSAGSTLDGFTVRNGNAYYGGGGIRIADDANAVRVQNCTIISNTAGRGGGGIEVRSANVQITGCTIMNNVASYGGGLLLAEAVSVTVANNLVISNTAIAGEGGPGQGGGINACCSSTGTIISNEIVSNTAIGSDASGGGGTFLWDGGTEFTLQDNLVQSNRAHHGGGILVGGGAYADILHNTIIFNVAVQHSGGLRVEWSGKALVDRNIIAYNQVSGFGGGGVWVKTDQPLTFTNNLIVHNESDGMIVDETYSATLLNNTIAFNSAEGVQIFQSTVLLRNNIVVSNTNCGINVLGGAVSTVTLEYNDFWSNTPEDYCNSSPGTNDISADPVFVNTAADDFHLHSDSPCVDAGTNADAPNIDFDGDPRPLDGDLDGVAIADMGADEFRPYQIYLPITLKHFGP